LKSATDDSDDNTVAGCDFGVELEFEIEAVEGGGAELVAIAAAVCAADNPLFGFANTVRIS
jgi:hypothetical protein